MWNYEALNLRRDIHYTTLFPHRALKNVAVLSQDASCFTTFSAPFAASPTRVAWRKAKV